MNGQLLWDAVITCAVAILSVVTILFGDLTASETAITVAIIGVIGTLVVSIVNVVLTRQVHGIVNSQRTEMMNRIAGLEQRLTDRQVADARTSAADAERERERDAKAMEKG